jgi:UDP-N-acetylmuramoylalanine--D-glutamate ligase
MKAAACMQTETIILLGGKNKGYDYKKLFAGLKKTKVVHAVLYGENRYQLLTCARELAYGSVTVCETFAFAVQVATLRAKAGQTVLLSPASASFDEFASYEERGDAFVQIVQSFQKESEQSAEETEFKSERFHETIDVDVDGDDIDGIDGVRADSIEGETE